MLRRGVVLTRQSVTLGAATTVGPVARAAAHRIAAWPDESQPPAHASRADAHF